MTGSQHGTFDERQIRIIVDAMMFQDAGRRRGEIIGDAIRLSGMQEGGQAAPWVQPFPYLRDRAHREGFIVAGSALLGYNIAKTAFFWLFLSFRYSCLLNRDSSSVTVRVRFRGRAWRLILAFLVGGMGETEKSLVSNSRKSGEIFQIPGNGDPDELMVQKNRCARRIIFCV